MDTFAISEAMAPYEISHKDDRSSQDTSKSPGSATKFQRAITAWRGIDLANTIARLDGTASDIVAQQRDALVQRKDLAQRTKDFRKLDDSSKLVEYKGLLKAYQAFVDLLTSQGKSSSSAFLQLYSSLSEAPDPYTLLEASVDSLVHSEETVPRLLSEKEYLQKSVDRLTSQLEDTEKRLQEERNTRGKLEENQEARVKEVESSWSAVLLEKSNNWEAKEKSLEERVQNQDHLIRELKATSEVSQRLGQGDDQDGSRYSATTAELELVSADLEKTSLRLAEVEARNEQLRLELARAISQPQLGQRASAEDDPAYLRLQSENSSLLRKLDAMRFDKDAERHTWESKLLQSERQSAKIHIERDELRSKLDRVADYEDIRRELEMIKSIEFVAGEDDDVASFAEGTVGADANDAPALKDNSQTKTLEQLLLTRNKKLTDELTVLRVSHQDLQNQLETLHSDFLGTKEELEKSQRLSATLENDLLRIQEEAKNAFPSSAMSAMGTYTSRYHQSSRRGGTSPTSSIISGLDHAPGSLSMLDTTRTGELVSSNTGILPMIQAQRDRFKKKNAELEEELSKMYSTVKSQRQEISALQKDNLSLYEKTRYASTYNRHGTSSSALGYSDMANTTAAHSTAGTLSSLPLDRYQSAYEAQISPFAAFRGRESVRAYKRMSLPERIVFSFTRIILANRTSRNLFAGYCLALHLLVFVMLYMMSGVDLEKHHAASLSAVSDSAAVVMAGRFGGSSGAIHGDDWQQEDFNAIS